MALLAIVLTLAKPLTNKVLENYSLKSDARKMATVMRYARQQAIGEGQADWVKFFIFENKYKDRDGNTYYLSDGISYVGTTTFTTEIANTPACIFLPSGVPSGGGTVTLKNEYNVKTYIIVNVAGGRVRISDSPPQS